MKQVLVTGAKGQLGQAIHQLTAHYPTFHFRFTDIDTLDICNRDDVYAFLKSYPADYIINCAAYTAVDKAESEPEMAFRINSDAVRNLAEIAVEAGAKIIHISTDYVFDGRSYIPYVEDDATNPLSVYGRSKLAGEDILQTICPESVILRTAWLYAEQGANFVNTMLRLGKEKEELGVVFDQVGTPTYARDLAEAILSILAQGENNFARGIYHYSNEGVCSWYDLAVKIMDLAGLRCRINPLETKDYPTKAVRPAYSVLNKKKIKDSYKIVIPHWEESLRLMIKG
ncbi:dTDP-4-dehydrorhamnose reductase [Parabacteroides sp. OttesenSCG-928-G07]|nr:dTDP-4-dehydrorhamnose reductase [Parabacteroides sp. OttesenSCG-928-G07]